MSCNSSWCFLVVEDFSLIIFSTSPGLQHIMQFLCQQTLRQTTDKRCNQSPHPLCKPTEWKWSQICTMLHIHSPTWVVPKTDHFKRTKLAVCGWEQQKRYFFLQFLVCLITTFSFHFDILCVYLCSISTKYLLHNLLLGCACMMSFFLENLIQTNRVYKMTITRLVITLFSRNLSPPHVELSKIWILMKLFLIPGHIHVFVAKAGMVTHQTLVKES